MINYIFDILLSFYFVFTLSVMTILTLISPRISALNKLEQLNEKTKEGNSKEEIEQLLNNVDNITDSSPFGNVKYFALFYFFNSLVYSIVFGIIGFNMLIIHFITLLISQVLGRYLRLYGITGQISSGKSSVSKYLISKGYTVIDVDSLNREVLEQEKVKNEIRKELGEEAFIKNTNTLNKLEIRRLIYNNPALKRKLENITHRRVLMKFLKLVIYNKFIKFNRKLFYENGILLKIYPLMLITYPIVSVVCTDENTVIQRIMNRDKCTEDEAKSVIKNQLSPKDYALKSDFLIQNNSTVEHLYEEVDEFLNILNGKNKKTH